MSQRSSNIPDVFRAVYRARGQHGETPGEAFSRAANFKGPHGIANHSPKLSKVTRRQRRLASLSGRQNLMRLINKAGLYRKGVEKWRIKFWSRAEDPVYETVHKVREGQRRKQRRVHGRIQPFPRPRPAGRLLQAEPGGHAV